MASKQGGAVLSAQRGPMMRPRPAPAARVQPLRLPRPFRGMHYSSQPAAGIAARAATSDAGEPAPDDTSGAAGGEEGEPKKKGRRSAAATAPKPKKAPLTEEEKAAKEAEKAAKAAAKREEKAAAKKAAEEEARLRAEAAASRRAQRNTAKGVVPELDVVTTPGGAAVPRGMQWFGLQCIDGKERYCAERLTFRFERYFKLVPGRDFQLLVARYPTEEEWTSRKKAAAKRRAAGQPEEEEDAGQALVNSGPPVVEGLVLLRIEMDELRSSAIETEPSVMGFKGRVALDPEATARGDGLRVGKLPAPVDPGLLKVLIDGAPPAQGPSASDPAWRAPLDGWGCWGDFVDEVPCGARPLRCRRDEAPTARDGGRGRRGGGRGGAAAALREAGGAGGGREGRSRRSGRPRGGLRGSGGCGRGLHSDCRGHRRRAPRLGRLRPGG